MPPATYFERINSREDRSGFKGTTASLDEYASSKGFFCGLPLALMFSCQHPEFADSISLSKSFLESIVEHGLLRVLDEEASAKPLVPKEDESEWQFHCSWFTRCSWKGQYGTVKVLKNKATGKFQKDFHPILEWQNRFEIIGQTIAFLHRFGIEEAEIKARTKLESKLSPGQRRSLLLSDSFYEMGKSGVMYFIRKNRPTIALRITKESEEDGKGTPLCALCLHPLGWFTGSFAGMMTPSDDMIAHLYMIRANEHLFWKKANQHQLDSMFSGI